MKTSRALPLRRFVSLALPLAELSRDEPDTGEVLADTEKSLIELK